jgi:uncharacterized protein
MLTDPLFYAAALPAVALYGLSKGGLAGVSLLAVPLMSLVMSPVRAAAILLPVLIVQDAVTVYSFRRSWDRRTLIYMLPGAMAGIALGALTAASMTDNTIRFSVGLLATLFCLNAWIGHKPSDDGARAHDVIAATAFATMSGYSSFVIHAGGAPYNVYTLPRIASRDVFVGTSAVFFALVNLIKLPPFLGLGQVTAETLRLSLVLLPVAIVANLAGIWVVRRLPTALFYKVIYGLTFIIGVKLVSEGASALWMTRVQPCT